MICYTFIRQDMEIQTQLVQAAHSSMEAGSDFKASGEIPFLICLGMKSGKELAKAEKYLNFSLKNKAVNDLFNIILIQKPNDEIIKDEYFNII
mgnify:CR=1 FL=1